MVETLKGIPVTEKMIEDLAQEAETGFDVAQLKKQGRGRPGRGATPSQVVAIRFTSEELIKLDKLASKANTTRSEIIRQAVLAP